MQECLRLHFASHLKTELKFCLSNKSFFNISLLFCKACPILVLTKGARYEISSYKKIYNKKSMDAGGDYRGYWIGSGRIVYRKWNLSIHGATHRVGQRIG
jgi:hypothetical protein